ncbi:lipid IV(A) 3-deoxy-D-manno-octulosonic acid transferase [Amantichitinum ursilacus]|uniref:3-deoxy-D-manno-octulosonic acid transferase n=1 Tax=Amantichitinum ursilacus TaxID=857265 RepID=A0A0N1JRD3_9NEIS|nr:lipid IV(A) 3-deoxy-D-manno-octulosonic acid transferase [Amantichitinum ursilacus]KPC49370.1 3-deoxy-D-manno-octulosonic acid transferase [Amantichitinum ursilacus]
MIVRWLYNLLLWAMTPGVALYLLRRARKQPAYKLNWDERWARYQQPTRVSGVIWLHAVSVGEVRAAVPLINALERAWPGRPLLLTCMTPTGRETAQSLLGDRVEIAYLPYDYPGATQRFLKRYQPLFGLLMETELWPNLVHACQRRKVPLFLVNARLSAKSAEGYRRVRWLLSPAITGLTGTFAQSKADAERLIALGAQNVSVVGNVKFDFEPATELVARGAHWRTLVGDRPVLLIASSREGEEPLLLDALEAVTLPPHTLLVLVPRHPQRFNEVAELLSQRGVRSLRRSAWDETPIPLETTVLLGDSMGELNAWYALADLAIIGGSILPFGSQNLIESCAAGTPVVLGPSTFNFAQAAQLALEVGAARQGQDATEVARLAAQWLNNRSARAEASKIATRFASAHRGATQRVLDLLKRRVPRD